MKANSHQLTRTIFSGVIVLIAAITQILLGSTASGEMLRGFGDITMSPVKTGEISGYQFECDSSEHAKVLLHKLSRDLSQSSTTPIQWVDVVLHGNKARALVRPGLGSYLPAAKDKRVWIWTSTQTEHLATVFSEIATQVNGASFYDPEFRYPAYLDKFSHYGIGSWYPSYWGDDRSISFTGPSPAVKDKPNSVDDHFTYATKHDLALQPNGGGYILRNLLPKIHEYNRPYHFAYWQEWSQELARMSPEDLVLPNDLFTTMPHYYGQISEGGQRLLEYRNWVLQGVLKDLVHDPLLVDWLDPNGEVGPPSFFKYWDFSENNRRNLVRYLQSERKYTLESLSEAWYGTKGQFKSWDQVPIPINYEFFGWKEGDPLANKTWRIHPVETDLKTSDSTSRPQPGEYPAYIKDGLEKGYQTENFRDDGWAALDLPGGELGAIYRRTKSHQFWCRGSIDVTEKWLEQGRNKGGRIYMTVASLTTANGWEKPDRLWINGREAAALSAPGGADLVAQVDVTDFVKAGKNSIVFLAAGNETGIGGPFFLTTRPLEEYPFKDSRLNARYYDWQDYISWCIADKMEQTYKAIRDVDKDRFIKMHAATDKHLGIPLQAKYGCFGHNTGEGAFFRPWDKRLGYPYGVPASAEFGGGITTDESIRRWVGWFTFEGLNAFDNFHNIQEMMHSPAKDAWLEYMPYLKLAPRRDIKRPDIALLFSSKNYQLLPRPVPYCFDLGRGDLQPIGYSYVYANESTIRDGKIKDYPVLWDTGTWIMSAETVSQIKAYVEAGGTFVALQETGRHTFTQRDAWPISELTGFKVREIRPMAGTLTILLDQPIFKKLAGKSYYNRGRSTDYSGYNYADKCLALEPITEGTIPLARYADGAIAIGMRKLGKGRVIVLGSPFWRDSSDATGMWWPGESQSLFLEDILDSLGLKALAKSDSHDIWKEHYLANNGTEEYLALFNPFKTAKTFTIEWRTAKPLSALYDPKNGKKIEGRIEGTTVKFDKVTLEGLETRIIAGATAEPPQEAIATWFTQLSRWWRPSASGVKLERPNLPVYDISLAEAMTGKVVSGNEVSRMDPAALSKNTTAPDDWKKWAGQSVEELRTKPDASRRVFLHSSIPLPKSWKAADQIELTVSVLGYGKVPECVGPLDVWINGQQVLKQQKCVARGYVFQTDGATVNITKQLNFHGENAICVVAHSGFVGEIKLRRHPQTSAEIEVKGEFNVQLDADHGVGKVMLPGSMQGLYGWKDDIVVPSSWKGSRVFITIDPDKFEDYEGFAINNKVIFHPINWHKAVVWMDITPWVKFGEGNRLTLISKAASREWKPGTIRYNSITLQQVKDP